jgi:hypothetical protein
MRAVVVVDMPVRVVQAAEEVLHLMMGQHQQLRELPIQVAVVVAEMVQVQMVALAL